MQAIQGSRFSVTLDSTNWELVARVIYWCVDCSELVRVLIRPLDGSKQAIQGTLLESNWHLSIPPRTTSTKVLLTVTLPGTIIAEDTNDTHMLNSVSKSLSLQRLIQIPWSATSGKVRRSWDDVIPHQETKVCRPIYTSAATYHAWFCQQRRRRIVASHAWPSGWHTWHVDQDLLIASQISCCRVLMHSTLRSMSL